MSYNWFSAIQQCPLRTAKSKTQYGSREKNTHCCMGVQLRLGETDCSEIRPFIEMSQIRLRKNVRQNKSQIVFLDRTTPGVKIRLNETQNWNHKDWVSEAFFRQAAEIGFLAYPTQICLVVCSLNRVKKKNLHETQFLQTWSKPHPHVGWNLIKIGFLKCMSVWTVRSDFEKICFPSFGT